MAAPGIRIDLKRALQISLCSHVIPLACQDGSKSLQPQSVLGIERDGFLPARLGGSQISLAVSEQSADVIHFRISRRQTVGGIKMPLRVAQSVPFESFDSFCEFLP